MSKQLDKAAREYLARQARESHPKGEFDNAQRFRPSEDERQECCDYIRPPSRTWPFSLMKHCRSIEHVANLFGVDITELRRRARELKAIETETPAVVDTPGPSGPTLGSVA